MLASMSVIPDRSQPQALASWKDGVAKRAIMDFVASASPGPEFAEVADRIAAFDNDGTLWVEQPLPPQFDFVFRKWAEEIKADPPLADKQPYKAVTARDPAFFAGVAAQDPEVVGTLLAAFGRSWKGSTPEEFDAQVHDCSRPSSSRRSACHTSSWCTSRCSSCSITCGRTSSGSSWSPVAGAILCGCLQSRRGGSSRRT